MKATEHEPEPIDGFEYEPTLGYISPYQQNPNWHPQGDPSALQSRDTRKTITVKQALRKANNNIAPFQSIKTSYVSKSKGDRW